MNERNILLAYVNKVVLWEIYFFIKLSGQKEKKCERNFRSRLYHHHVMFRYKKIF